VASPLQAYEQAQNVRLDWVAALLAQDARSWAAQLRLVAELTAAGEAAGREPFLELELAGSGRISQLTATRWISEARRFSTALPGTLAMLKRGELLRHQAMVLLHRTSNATVAVARAVEAELLPAAAALCPSDLARRVDRLVLRIESEQADPADAEQRHADALAQRRTFIRPQLDGMGLAGAVLPAEQLVGWAAGMDALELRERAADRAAGIERTADQRRADLFAALPALVLAGTAQQAAGPDRRPWTFGPEQLAAHIVLNVHVPVATVLDLSRAPGTLDRYGPLSAEHIRLLRPTRFRRVMVEGHTGRPIAVDDRRTPVDPDPVAARAQIRQMLRPDVAVDTDEPQHDPSARLARLIDIRDVRCAGPGCSSRRTERDHLIRYPHGPTSARNLGLLSARCHHAKHDGWTLTRHPDGSVTWQSPLGRTYHRPGPHDPPPQADLYDDPPPPRRPPTGATPWDSQDRPLSHDLPAAPHPPPPPDDVRDEPPPF